MRIPKILVVTFISLLLTVMLVTPAFAATREVTGTCAGYSVSGNCSCSFAINGAQANTLISGTTADVYVMCTIHYWNKTYTWADDYTTSENRMNAQYAPIRAYVPQGWSLDDATSSHTVRKSGQMWSQAIQWFDARNSLSNMAIDCILM